MHRIALLGKGNAVRVGGRVAQPQAPMSIGGSHGIASRRADGAASFDGETAPDLTGLTAGWHVNVVQPSDP